MKLTTDAASMIQDLVEGLPRGAGVRIAPRQDHEALAMSLVASARPGDLVVTDHDANVFLAPVAHARLADQTLDARRCEYGAAFFVQP